jgi:flagellar hook-associated protein 1 FlgK
MSKIHGMMDVGKRSMMNSQTALQTVGHNIANKATEGYSRQRVELQSHAPSADGRLRIGMGSKAAQVTRVNNPYLEKQIGKERGELGYQQGRADAMTRVEQVYNEQVNKGLNSSVSDFFNAFREFSNNPESLSTRTQVKESADFLTKDFKRVQGQLEGVQSDIDQQIYTHVTEINEVTREIASLNEKIKMVQIAGGAPNDERDRRDLLLKQLGEKINIRSAEGEDGTVTVSAGTSALLVAGVESKGLEVRRTPASGIKGEGNYDLFLVSSPYSEPMKVTEQMTGGSIGGLLEVRDKLIGDLLDDVDRMALGLASTVNELHSRGFDASGKAGGEFFRINEGSGRVGSKLQVADSILRDVNKIAGASAPNSPGDNRVADAISQLQFETLMTDQGATLDEYYNSMVGKVGIQARRAESAVESQKDIVKQLQNIRESISGVSLDEETTKLLEFQKAFDASARLIRTADELFDTVLSIKRM